MEKESFSKYLGYSFNIVEKCFECRKCVRICTFLENYCVTPKDLVLKFQYLKKEVDKVVRNLRNIN